MTFLMIICAALLAYGSLFPFLSDSWRPAASQPDELMGLFLIFGWPVIVCAWPLHLSVLRWVARQTWSAGKLWWSLPLVGAGLFPLPLVLQYVVLAGWLHRPMEIDRILIDLMGTVIFGASFGLYLGLLMAVQLSRPERTM